MEWLDKAWRDFKASADPDDLVAVSSPVLIAVSSSPAVSLPRDTSAPQPPNTLPALKLPIKIAHEVEENTLFGVAICAPFWCRCSASLGLRQAERKRSLTSAQIAAGRPQLQGRLA